MVLVVFWSPFNSFESVCEVPKDSEIEGHEEGTGPADKSFHGKEEVVVLLNAEILELKTV